MVERYWPDEEALGKTIRTGSEDNGYVIVGVVGNSKYRNLREEGRLYTYFPLAQRYAARINLVARTLGDQRFRELHDPPQELLRAVPKGELDPAGAAEQIGHHRESTLLGIEE